MNTIHANTAHNEDVQVGSLLPEDEGSDTYAGYTPRSKLIRVQQSTPATYASLRDEDGTSSAYPADYREYRAASNEPSNLNARDKRGDRVEALLRDMAVSNAVVIEQVGKVIQCQTEIMGSMAMNNSHLNDMVIRLSDTILLHPSSGMIPIPGLNASSLSVHRGSTTARTK
jgi:hypothetical protein